MIMMMTMILLDCRGSVNCAQHTEPYPVPLHHSWWLLWSKLWWWKCWCCCCRYFRLQIISWQWRGWQTPDKNTNINTNTNANTNTNTNPPVSTMKGLTSIRWSLFPGWVCNINYYVNDDDFSDDVQCPCPIKLQLFLEAPPMQIIIIILSSCRIMKKCDDPIKGSGWGPKENVLQYGAVASSSFTTLVMGMRNNDIDWNDEYKNCGEYDSTVCSQHNNSINYFMAY